MQNYRKSKIEELKFRQNVEKEKELQNLASSWNEAGRYPSCDFIEQFINVSEVYVSKLIDPLCEIYKTVLIKKNSQTISQNYFDELQSELLKLIDDEYYDIRCKVYKHCKRMTDNERGICLGKVEEKRNLMSGYIKTRVKTLQEEFKMGILQSATGTTINIGGDVGVINTGTIYGSIQVKLEQIKKSDKILAEAYERLTETINNSNINNDEKHENLENVEFLVTQSATPKNKRVHGIIKSITNFFSLSTVADIATIWAQVAPIISEHLQNK